MKKSAKNEKSEEIELTKKVLRLARSCNYEKKHSHQVTKVALLLFEHLRSLHKLGERERLLLQWGGLLHDIGWVKGWRKHHKSAARLILAAGELPFGEREKTIVALIARYHRRALPKDSHRHFSELSPPDKETVKKLASLLRMADGMDRTHLGLVQALDCEILPEKVIVHIKAKDFSDTDKTKGKAKAELFETVFEKEVVIDWASV